MRTVPIWLLLFGGLVGWFCLCLVVVLLLVYLVCLACLATVFVYLFGDLLVCVMLWFCLRDCMGVLFDFRFCVSFSWFYLGAC